MWVYINLQVESEIKKWILTKLKIMNRSIFDDEEVCDDELRSVAITGASVVIFVISLITWVLII